MIKFAIAIGKQAVLCASVLIGNVKTFIHSVKSEDSEKYRLILHFNLVN